MTVVIKDYVRVAADSDGMFRVRIDRNLPDGVQSQLLSRRFKNRKDAEVYRSGVRHGINVTRNGYA